MTDHEYIERVRKAHRRRKISGFTGFLICLVCGFASYLLFLDTGRMTDEIFEADTLLREGRAVEAEDIDLINSYFDLAQAYGERDGALVGRLLTTSAIFGTFSLIFAFSGRKDRLLLSYHDSVISNKSL